MARDFGKAFEAKFKEDFLKLPNSTIDRLYDTTSGYKSIKQVSDFIGYKKPLIYYLECKTCKGASLPLSNISQYESLCKKIGIPGVRAGVVLWLYEKDKVLYIPAATLRALKKANEKSVGIRHLKENYPIIDLPSVKKRTFMTTDYTPLLYLEEGF